MENPTIANSSGNGRPFNWKLIPVFILGLYVFLELVTYLLICSYIWRPDFLSVVSDEFVASDKPYTRFDSISGYKYTGTDPRLVNITGNVVRYDHIMHINNRGYSSVYNYNYAKKPGIKRWMVLGASYCAGEITDTTWIDKLNKKMQNDSIELYSFSLEASGIRNWHNIFFKEIVPDYDFDGLIIAVNGDLHPLSYDIARSVYAVKNSFADYTGLGFFTELSENTASFERDSAKLLVHYSSTYDDATLNIYKNEKVLHGGNKAYFKWMPVKAYFMGYLTQAFRLINNFIKFYKIYHLNDIDHNVLRGDYAGNVNYNTLFGADNMRQTDDILRYCAENNKGIYLISMPSVTIVNLDSAFYHHNLYNRHLKQLSEKYDGYFFDGYRIFDSIPKQQWNDYHINADGHWNEAGINLFVKLFYGDNKLKVAAPKAETGKH